MNSFESKVYNFIKDKEMVSPGSTVLVGFSGGADSTALLLVLNELKRLLGIELLAVHVNHGIRQEAGEDAEFTRMLCEKLEIEYQLVEKDIPRLSKEWKMTEEEAGRKARYDEFMKIAGKNGASRIAIAHHQNDAAETLLMNLLRGSGIHGAGGIRPVRDNIIRPLLCVSRQEIEVYLKDKGQNYCHDATNDENTHTRNIIRNVLLPTMEKEINSEAVSHLCRAAENFCRADELIREMTGDWYGRLVTQDECGLQVELKGFRNLDEVIRADLLLMCLEKLTPNRKDITSAHIEALLSLCRNSSGNSHCDLPYGISAERAYDVLRLDTGNEHETEAFDAQIPIPQLMDIGDKIDLTIPYLGVAHIEIMPYNGRKLFPSSAYTKWFDYDRIQGAIFRNRTPEDYIFLEQDKGLCRKRINKLMTDEKIPKSKRDSMYLLADGNDVIWVPGYRMSGAYKVSETTKKVLAISIDKY